MKFSRLVAILVICGFLVASGASRAQISTPLYDTDYEELSFVGGTHVSTSSPAGTVGARYRYNNVITVNDGGSHTIDAIVEIKELVGRTIADFDPAASANVVSTSTIPQNQQQHWFILTTGASGAGSTTRGHVTLEFKFVENIAGVETPVILQNVAINSFDIDGTSNTASTSSHPALNLPIANGKVNQFTEFGGFQLSELSTGNASGTTTSTPAYGFPSLLQAIYNPSTGLTTFVSQTNINNNQAPGTAAGDRFRVRVLYDELSVFQISMGSYSGASTFGLQFAKGPSWARNPEMTRTPELNLTNNNLLNPLVNVKDRAASFTGTLVRFSLDAGGIYPLTTGLSSTSSPGIFLEDPAPVQSATTDNLKVRYSLGSVSAGDRLVIPGINIIISFTGNTGGSFMLGGLSWNYAFSTEGGERVITFTKSSGTRAEFEALLDALHFYTTTPGSSSRQFSLTIEDQEYTSPPALFTVTMGEGAEPGVQELMTKSGPLELITGVSGDVYNGGLQVHVKDEDGSEVVGANVVFSITAGGGSLSGTTTVQTNSSGYALYLGNWTLGNPGTNTVTATFAGSASSVSFDALVDATITGTVSLNGGSGDEEDVELLVEIDGNEAGFSPISPAGDGSYEFVVPYQSLVTVTPFLSGYAFEPVRYVIESAEENFEADFIGYSRTPSAGHSTVEAVPASAPANGSSVIEIVVQVNDASGDPVGAGIDVFLAGDIGTFASSTWKTDAFGIMKGFLQAPTTPGAGVITAYLGSNDQAPVIGTTSVTFTVVSAPSPSGGGSRGGGGSVAGQVQNLLNMGNTQAANNLASQWAHLFPGQVPPATQAQAIALLQSQIQALIAQIVALGGTPAAEATTPSGAEAALPSVPPGQCPRHLFYGMQGDDVRALQTLLMNLGYSIPPGASSLFVNYTRDALAAYQRANNISPAVGYFGPTTCAQMKAANLPNLWW